jgi:hypothetical protein
MNAALEKEVLALPADERVKLIGLLYESLDADPYLDSDEVAEKVLEARRGKYTPHDPRDFEHILQRVIAKKK